MTSSSFDPPIPRELLRYIEKSVVHAIELAVHKELFTIDEAGHIIGKSDNWLRDNGKLHPLFAPSNSRGVKSTATKGFALWKLKKGERPVYHVRHLRLIVAHLVAPEIITKDDAWNKWQRERLNIAAA